MLNKMLYLKFLQASCLSLQIITKNLFNNFGYILSIKDLNISRGVALKFSKQWFIQKKLASGIYETTIKL